MKYKFDDTFLELGFIKELLKEFNLPKCQVLTDDTKLYDNELYIDNLNIYKYSKLHGLMKITDYYFNRPILNLTKNMSITTSYYSTELHEYLGEYLRFIRDYKRLNLMSLYNCFSNKVIFPTNYDDSYNYYALPVKFGQVYTIGFDSTIPIEIYCILWDTTQIGEYGNESETLLDKLKKDTLDIISGCKINKPFIYTKIKDLDASDYLKQRDNLRLVIKMPNDNKTSITVLEGDYIFDTVIDNKVTTTAIFNADHFNYGSESSKKEFKYFKTYPTNLSLFSVNDNIKHPFADRLLEYLLDYAVTQIDELDDNIKRTQEYLKYLKLFTPKILYGVWDEDMNDTIYKIENQSYVSSAYEKDKVNYVKGKTNIIGWDGENKKYQRNLIDVKSDLLTYVDKDVESLFLATGLDDKYTR